ncbi:MAG: hypothetical protein F6K25_26615, partial [Okeania sp. SIO2G4]|uniref:hypothetical protein n=1 Tax=unclassified Okeania TaxID=2634635 RepID=UPI0013BB2E36
LSSSSILRCSWILKRLGIMAIAPGNYFSPLQLYTNDATGHDIRREVKKEEEEKENSLLSGHDMKGKKQHTTKEVKLGL